MKHTREIFKRILPVITVVLLVIILSQSVYHKTMQAETEECWERLDVAAEVMAEKLNIRFSDNINLLERVADAVSLMDDFENSTDVSGYLESVRNATIFERIDMLFPDGRILYQNHGFGMVSEDNKSFDEIIKNGSHISERYLDRHTESEVIYFATPILAKGEIKAMLLGVVSCDQLKNIFPVHIYGGDVRMIIFDRADGNIISDNRSNVFGNIYTTKKPEPLEEYKNIDFTNEIISGNHGRGAFKAPDGSNQNAYMSYQPIFGENYKYQLCFVVQENVAFAGLQTLYKTLTVSGFCLSILVLIFSAWTVYVVLTSVKNAERAKKAEIEKVRNEAKSQFLSSVSHDIRTPLNGIIGMLDIIKRREQTPKILEESLHKIEVSARYLETLANDVLDLNDIENGKIALLHTPFDLCQFAEDLQPLIQPKIDEFDIDYSLNYSAVKHKKVFGSEVHIRRVIMNLLTNAIKYNKKGGQVRLTIEEISSNNRKATYCFSVADTGIGMSEEFQKNMFKAFEQENVGARTNHMGHGLGLSIVSQLVEKMDGSVTVHSRKDEGSVFTVLLPLDIEEDDSHKSPKELPECADINGAKILIAEDNELNLEIANILLTDAGAEIVSAANGHIAYETFKASENGEFDVILMDLMMPDMNGFEATAAIRALDRPDAKTVPIIAMTASTFAEDIEHCKSVGINANIPKPMDIKSTVTTIAKYIKK